MTIFSIRPPAVLSDNPLSPAHRANPATPFAPLNRLLNCNRFRYWALETVREAEKDLRRDYPVDRWNATLYSFRCDKVDPAQRIAIFF